MAGKGRAEALQSCLQLGLTYGHDILAPPARTSDNTANRTDIHLPTGTLQELKALSAVRYEADRQPLRSVVLPSVGPGSRPLNCQVRLVTNKGLAGVC